MSGLQTQDTALKRCGHRLCTTGDAEFAKDVDEVCLDRGLADVELARDLFVACAPGDARENLDLADAERLFRRGTHLSQQARGYHG